MRKVAPMVVAALVVLCTAVVAIADTTPDGKYTQTVKVTIGKLGTNTTPSVAGTLAKPKGVTFQTSLNTVANNGAPDVVVTKATIFVSKGIKLQGEQFVTCSKAVVAVNPANCPKGSKVGSGSAFAVSGTLKVPLDVLAYNTGSGTSKGKQILLYLCSGTASEGNPNCPARRTSPILVNSVIEGTRKAGSGLYAYKVEFPVPSSVQQPVPGVYTALKQFVVKFGATTRVRGVNVSYAATTSCPATKRWSFRGTFSTIIPPAAGSPPGTAPSAGPSLKDDDILRCTQGR